MNPILQFVDSWLLDHHEIETDRGGDDQKFIGFQLDRCNKYDNVIFSLNNDSVLAWYGDPLITGSEVDASPFADKLDHYLLRANQGLGVGRWSRTKTGDLLFDVSIPIHGSPPSSQTLSHIYEIACDAFDQMISRIRLLLETGMALENPSSTVYTECLQIAANDPALLARLEALGLVTDDAANAITRIMKMSHSDWSDSLQEQTREAIDEMRVAPDGLMHLKHRGCPGFCVNGG
jgi:hypothetical protein